MMKHAVPPEFCTSTMACHFTPPSFSRTRLKRNDSGIRTGTKTYDESTNRTSGAICEGESWVAFALLGNCLAANSLRSRIAHTTPARVSRMVDVIFYGEFLDEKIHCLKLILRLIFCSPRPLRGLRLRLRYAPVAQALTFGLRPLCAAPLRQASLASATLGGFAPSLRA